MQFIGSTALVDAVICLVALIVVLYRRSQLETRSETTSSVSYFVKYLIFTFIFLVLIGITLLWVPGPSQPLMFFVTDLILWVSLAYMIAFAYQGRPSKSRNIILVLFFIFALSRSIYQLMGIIGISPALDQNIVYVLSSLDLWLMYAVWVPTAVYFIIISLMAENSLTRTRSLMFGIGLLLITFTWAFRTLSTNPSFMVVSVVSIIGFALLLAGVIYRKQAAPALA